MYDVKQQIRMLIVWMFMVRHASRHGSSQSQTGYRVELPRVHDAIGVVLRDIYEREPDIPDDMAGLLRRINGRLQISR